MTRCDGETGQAGNRDNPPNVGGVTAWYAERDPVRGPHQGQQSKADCINRPDRRLLPTNANTSNFSCNAGAIHRRRSPECGGSCPDVCCGWGCTSEETDKQHLRRRLSDRCVSRRMGSVKVPPMSKSDAVAAGSGHPSVLACALAGLCVAVNDTSSSGIRRSVKCPATAASARHNAQGC